MRPLKSRLASVLVHPSLQKLSSMAFESRRRLGRNRHQIVFYHRVADAWSWLLAQCLPQLAEEYNVDIEIRLVSALPIDAIKDPERLDQYAAYDAMRLARAWNLEFPDGVHSPASSLTELAERIILAAPVNSLEKLNRATAAVWAADSKGLASLARTWSAVSEKEADAILSRNNRILSRRGHYLGGMLWFQGEWFWGLDRLHFLEKRLRQYNLNVSEQTISARMFKPLQRHSAGNALPLDLEYFFSFRSPYSYLGALRVTELADRLGLNLVLRPLLPMIMRGTPVPARKIRYIIRDTARIARQENMAFGPLRDPLGKGVENALAIFHHADRAGAGRSFMLAVMRAIWTEAADLTRAETMYSLASSAGLTKNDVDEALSAGNWRAQLEANSAALAVLGLWGVPSLCLRGPDDMPLSVAWGQDRMWAIERAALGVDVSMPLPRMVEKI